MRRRIRQLPASRSRRSATSSDDNLVLDRLIPHLERQAVEGGMLGQLHGKGMLGTPVRPQDRVDLRHDSGNLRILAGGLQSGQLVD